MALETSAKLEMADFEAALNSEFQMDTNPEIASGTFPLGETPSNPLALQTITLTQCKVKLLNSIQECFSLVFKAPIDAPQVQALYRLSHPVIGTADIFLVPFKKTDEGLFYEAVFNRLIG